MDFLLPPDLIEFNKVVRDFCEQSLPASKRRERMIDRPHTAELASANASLESGLRQLGVIEAVLPESQGGLGFGLLAGCALAVESGRALLPVPLFETVSLAIVPLLSVSMSSAEGERGGQLLASILAGQTATGALFELVSGSDLCVARPDPADAGRYQLSGTLRFVPSIDCCSQLIIPARIEDMSGSKGASGQVHLFSIELPVLKADSKSKDGLTSSSLETFDLFRRYYDLQLDSVVANLVTTTGLDPDGVSALVAKAQLLAAAEVSGAAGAAFDLTLAYVKIRKQFDKPLGSFQAIQHKLADMHTELERASALIRFASWCADNDPAQLESAAAAAAVIAFSDLPKLIESAIQLHGGIGFTYEYDLHLYLRRAITLSRVLSCGGNNELALAETYLPG